ncbi:hypothetical protein J4418_01730 [Candidatus Woesearchaeota archaeon]|nr:hypothetical protein [Candidatus Woesearchaeota archaeon]
MNKKGDLSLSVNTIVIIVLAITLLGLGLTFIQTLVGGAADKIGGYIDVVDLAEKPTSSNPLVVPRELEVKLNSNKNVNIGFYNKGPASATNVKPILDECITLTDDTADGTITLVSLKKDSVAPSESQGYKAVLTVEDVPEGNYICTLTMEASSDESNLPSTDFYLNVIS